jgi:hypothetical protein
MRKLFFTALTALVLLAGPLGTNAMAAAPDPADAIQVFDRDVFEIVGSTLRNPTAATEPDSPLFTNSGILIESTPGDTVTWGEWSAASATSSVMTVGGPNGPRTDVRLELTGLVPGGRYSVFWGTLQPDSEHPGCPGVERTLPLDAFHQSAGAPDPNSFVAGGDGASEFRGRVDGALLDAGQAFFSVVYHFLGESSYPFPNLGEFLTQGENCRSSYGEDSMRHLIILQKL